MNIDNINLWFKEILQQKLLQYFQKTVITGMIELLLFTLHATLIFL